MPVLVEWMNSENIKKIKFYETLRISTNSHKTFRIPLLLAVNYSFYGDVLI